MADIPALGELILAAGALGTSAFGIAEGLKWTGLGHAGFSRVESVLGTAAMGALGLAYGPKSNELLRAQYSNGRNTGDLPKTLRQGLRIGLSSENAESLANDIGVVDAQTLKSVATKLKEGKELTDDERGVLGRFEIAIDARIDAALALAERTYRGSIRGVASFFAVGLALVAAYFLAGEDQPVQWQAAFIVGIAAVPLAPIAKDVSQAIQSAAKAIGARK